MLILILNYILGIVCIVIGILDSLIIAEKIKPSPKFIGMKKRFGDKYGTFLYFLFYVVMPTLFGIWVIYLAANNIAFFFD